MQSVRLPYLLTYWLIDCLTDSLTDSLTHWSIDLLSDWYSDWLVYWLAGIIAYRSRSDWRGTYVVHWLAGLLVPVDLMTSLLCHSLNIIVCVSLIVKIIPRLEKCSIEAFRHGRRLSTEFGGDGKKFSGKISEWPFLGKNLHHLTPKNFWWPFFWNTVT